MFHSLTEVFNCQLQRILSQKERWISCYWSFYSLKFQDRLNRAEDLVLCYWHIILMQGDFSFITIK